MMICQLFQMEIVKIVIRSLCSSSRRKAAATASLFRHGNSVFMVLIGSVTSLRNLMSEGWLVGLSVGSSGREITLPRSQLSTCFQSSINAIHGEPDSRLIINSFFLCVKYIHNTLMHV